MLEKIVKNFVAVTRSRYQFRDKIKLFIALITLYLKSRVRRDDSHLVTHKILGFVVTAYDYGTLNYLFKEIFLSEEYYFESEHPRPVIIDCGANIGMSVLYFKFLYPDCSVIAFEPNPFAFVLLERNIYQNNLKNVDLKNIGLSNTETIIQFFIGENKGGLSSSMIKERGGENTISIQSGRLSEFMQDTTFDLIKMDVEGVETKVLEDLLSADKLGNANKYIIEYHHKMYKKKSSLSTFVKPFEDVGFEYNLRTTYQQSGDFQDVLLSFYKDAE